MWQRTSQPFPRRLSVEDACKPSHGGVFTLPKFIARKESQVIRTAHSAGAWVGWASDLLRFPR
jgi:hypothetical protein